MCLLKLYLRCGSDASFRSNLLLVLIYLSASWFIFPFIYVVSEIEHFELRILTISFELIPLLNSEKTKDCVKKKNCMKKRTEKIQKFNYFFHVSLTLIVLQVTTVLNTMKYKPHIFLPDVV